MVLARLHKDFLCCFNKKDEKRNAQKVEMKMCVSGLITIKKQQQQQQQREIERARGREREKLENKLRLKKVDEKNARVV